MAVAHPSHLIWFANLAVLFAWFLIADSLLNDGSKVAAVLVSGLALVIAASFLLPVGIVDNAGGVPVPILSRGAGYWLWLVSMLSAFASAVLLPVQSPTDRSSATG